MNMREKYKQAKEYLNSKKLYATDFCGTTIIHHSDNSILKYTYSIMEQKEEFVYVWTEHQGYHFYLIEDLVSIEYKREIFGTERCIKSMIKDFIEDNNIKDSFDINNIISPPDEEVDEYTANEFLKDICDAINYGREEE